MVDEPERIGAACRFCQVDPARMFLAPDSIVGLWDAFPVSPGHALLVPRRHVTTWFDAGEAEQLALAAAVGEARAPPLFDRTL